MAQLMRPIVFVLSMATVCPLWAADIETQHAFDVTLPLKPRLELILHSRIRTQPGGLGFYQVRGGPVVSWDVTPRISLLSGYYYTRQERKIDNDFIGGHRLFGGLKSLSWKPGVCPSISASWQSAFCRTQPTISTDTGYGAG
jgi:hypothetical protein